VTRLTLSWKNYLARKIVTSFVTLFLLTSMTFFLVRLAPGSPFEGEQAWPLAMKETLNQEYGLDQSVALQFNHWLKNLMKGDLGKSYEYQDQDVLDLLRATFPVSLALGLSSLVFSLFFGIFLGCVAAWKKTQWQDHLICGFSVAAMSLPSYLLASLLILTFSTYFKWLPPALWESPKSAVLPIATLSLRPIAMITRLMRTSTMSALSSDYIRSAYGRGLPEKVIIFKHALKNSVIPVVAVFGPLSASLITGSFLVEVVYQIPGLGKYFVQAVLNRDYPLVMGTTLVYGVVLLACNFLMDLAYPALDPRIRLT
jgi:oligopeptide transport system permease protein